MERLKANGGGHVNSAFDSNLGDPPIYEETEFSNNEHRTVRPSVMSAFGHDTLDRVPNIDFYRNAGSVSGHRAVRPSLQELHDVFQKVSLLETWCSMWTSWHLFFLNPVFSFVVPSFHSKHFGSESNFLLR